jgi:hypothetical protein
MSKKNKMSTYGSRTRMNQNRSTFFQTFIAPNHFATPFRLVDHIMLIGKHKGKNLNDLETSYIQWMHDNMEMGGTHRAIVKEILKSKK